MQTYFVITCSDGDTLVSQMDGQELLRRTASGEFGEEPRFLQSMPDNSDPCCWPDGAVLVLRGEVSPPRAVARATEWRLRE